MRRYVFGLVIFWALVFWAAVAFGQEPQKCWSRAYVVQQMGQQHRATWTAAGLTDGGMVELYTSAGGAMWAMFLTTPQGISCIVATGEGWRTDPPDPGACNNEDPWCV